MQPFVPVEALFKGRHFDGCVSWYTSFKLSLRDLVIMMADRGITLTNTTVLVAGPRPGTRFEVDGIYVHPERGWSPRDLIRKGSGLHDIHDRTTRRDNRRLTLDVKMHFAKAEHHDYLCRDANAAGTS